MHRITADRPHPLHDCAATRALENQAQRSLPAHALMQRAAHACARLARALAPHAQRMWLACGGGNNGGDGLLAAALLHQAGLDVTVTWLGTPETSPPDALHSWHAAQDAGVCFADAPPPLGTQDLCVDALLGIGLRTGSTHSPDARLLDCLHALHASHATLLNVDLPSGLVADTGHYAPGFEALAATDPTTAGTHQQRRHTLALLTLKSGLFTAHGRDAAGGVWYDDLGVDAATHPPQAWLAGAPAPSARAHASHKGSFGDVAVIGGEGLAACGMGMTGAAVLAASAALHAGAGRVMVALLDGGATAALPQQPALMLRRFDALELAHATVVCGCGGGAAVATVLAQVLQQAGRLVLDADALNTIAADTALRALLAARSSRAGCATALTPHPLEAARLLGTSSAAVQADRLSAANQLAQQLGCAVVLKGSGSVVAAPGRLAHINPTGNARLASAGTGDVLAGLLGARLAAQPRADLDGAFAAASAACWQHGALADAWPAHQALTADRLAQAITP